MRTLEEIDAEIAEVTNELSNQQTTADSLKIVINSSFGKFGNKYSAIFSPSLLIHTTLTGQLLLLKLIEMMNAKGIDVVNANTDGIVCYFPDELRPAFEDAWSEWEMITNLELEETKYKSLMSIHVNNYCAIKPDGKVKGKADFAPAGFDVPSPFGLQKNPQAPIICESVKNHLAGKTHYIDAIKKCQDPFMFCFLRKVSGGCEWDLQDVGATIRWYIGKEFRLPMTYLKSGNNVPNTANGVIANELPEEMPDDLDMDYYIRAAAAMIEKVNPGQPYEFQGALQEQRKQECDFMLHIAEETLKQCGILDDEDMI